MEQAAGPPMTVAEFSARYNVPLSTTYYWISGGELRATRVGTRLRITEAAAKEFLARSQANTAAEVPA